MNLQNMVNYRCYKKAHHMKNDGEKMEKNDGLKSSSVTYLETQLFRSIVIIGGGELLYNTAN